MKFGAGKVSETNQPDAV